MICSEEFVSSLGEEEKITRVEYRSYLEKLGYQLTVINKGPGKETYVGFIDRKKQNDLYTLERYFTDTDYSNMDVMRIMRIWGLWFEVNNSADSIWDQMEKKLKEMSLTEFLTRLKKLDTIISYFHNARG